MTAATSPAEYSPTGADAPPMPALLTAMRSGPSSLAAADATLRELRVGHVAHQARGGSARGVDLADDGLRRPLR